jgi:hypothetical protein
MIFPAGAWLSKPPQIQKNKPQLLAPRLRPRTTNTSSSNNPHIMKYITTFSILIVILFSRPVAAQQWESFLSPPFPRDHAKMLTIEDNIFTFTNNGLQRSKDGGNTWEQLRSYQSDNVAQVLEVNRNNKRLYWSEGLDTMGFYQLFSSADLGNTWQAVGNVKAGVSAFIGDTIYGPAYGTGYDIARKLGAGPWTPLPNWQQGDTTGGIYSMSGEGTHLWVATLKGIYHSPDAGYTWEHSLLMDDVQVTSNLNGMSTFLIKALNGEVVVTDEIKKRIYFSKNHGATWHEAPW